MNLPPACNARELFEHALESSSRALAGDPELLISFPGQTKSGESTHPVTPIIDQAMTGEQVTVLRGYCDSLAVKLRYHNADLHQQVSPAGPLSRAVFNALEDLRIEIVASRAYSGVALNLAAAFAQKSRLLGPDMLKSDTATPLANAAVLMLRASLLERPLTDTLARYVSRWQDDIDTRVGEDIQAKLEQFADTTEDQLSFAECSLLFIKSLELMDEPENNPQTTAADPDMEYEAGTASTDQNSSESSPADNEEKDSSQVAASLSADEEQKESLSSRHTEPGTGVSSSVISFPKNKDHDSVSMELDSIQAASAEPGNSDQASNGVTAYHAYTTRFDQLVQARDLLDKHQLKHLRAELDQETFAHRQVAVRLAKRLQNSLTTLQKRAWTFDLDDGLLDTTRLSRLVTDPYSPLVYQQERDSQTCDTVVSFLVDNSGSMRGRPIVLAAMFTDILAQALERSHVVTEILGFTTSQWRGGQTCQSWRTAGKPGDPGRLSDLRHVVYKTADEPWRRARQSLGVMLWPELLKENVDGEALLWAHRRLCARSEQRRILMVISDGVAADDATLTANASDYLESHLRQVIQWIETKSSVEILAVGIGHDVSNVYTRSVTIADSEQLGDAMAHELIELLGNVPSTARYPLAVNR